MFENAGHDSAIFAGANDGREPMALLRTAKIAAINDQ